MMPATMIRHALTRRRAFAPTAVLAVGLLAASLGGACLETATVVCEATGMRCEAGKVCTAEEDGCMAPGGCGDGIRSGDEVCDDGNIRDGDGCSADCSSQETCGNTKVDVGETCDDGNTVDGDRCSAHCILEACGNGITDVGEECDTLATDSRSCDLDCTFIACGDGHVNASAGEDCDDGMSPSARCNSPVFCKLSRCGDSFTNSAAGEQCDTGGDGQGCNGSGGDGADAQTMCHLPSCGDGYVNEAFTPPGATTVEQCDNRGGADSARCNGNNGSRNGPGSCRAPTCGDGYLNRQHTIVDDPSSDPPRTHQEECDPGGPGIPAILPDPGCKSCNFDCTCTH